MLKYHVRLVIITDTEEHRFVSEFDVNKWESVDLALQYINIRDGWQLVFATVSDNDTKTRLQGSKALVTFYDLKAALDILKGQEFQHHNVLLQRMGDFILSHKVKREDR